MKAERLKIKIVCTIGPASRSEQKLSDLMRSGMGMARLNFAHGTLSQHAVDIKRIRKVAKRQKTQCPILVDLPGPKIRVGHLKHEPLHLRKGHVVLLTSRSTTRSLDEIIPVDYPQLAQSVKEGALDLS